MKKLFYIIICLISSIYMTYIIQITTLVDPFQKGFVFIYFIIIIGIILKIYSKKMKIYSLTSKIIIGVVSLLILVYTKDSFILSKYEDIKISVIATAEKNILSNANEVWIREIIINNEKLDLSSIKLSEGWDYKEEDNCIYSNPYNTSYFLDLEFTNMKNIKIVFGTHDWSGKVRIINNNEEKEFDLYSENGGTINYDSIGKQKNIQFDFYLILFFGCYAIIYLCLAGVFFLLFKNFKIIPKVNLIKK